MTATNSYPKKPIHVSRIHPSIKEQWLSKATIYYQTGYYGKALKACERAIQIDHNYSKAHSGKSLALCHLERYEEALTIYEQAIKLDTTNFKAYVGRGRILYELKHYEEALVAYEQAILLEPNYDKAYIGKGRVLYGLRRYEGALTAYRRVSRTYSLGRIASEEGV